MSRPPHLPGIGRVTALVAVACITLIPSFALSQPLADKIPDDALIYVGWRGGDSPMPGFEQSHLKALLANSNIPAVFNDMLPKVLAKAAKEGGADGAAVVDALNMLAKPMWKYPTAAYFALDASGAEPRPRIAIICKAGATDGAGVQQKLDELIATIHKNEPPPVPVKSFLAGDLVGLAIGFEDGADAIAGGGTDKAGALAASGAFTNALKQNGMADPGMIVYFDVENVMSFVEAMVARSNDPNLQANWPKAREASGLSGLKRVVITMGFDGPDWSSRAFVEAPAPRKGILAGVSGSPVPEDLYKLVPASATSVAAFSFDPARFITEVRTSVGEVDPDWQVKMDQGLGVVKMYVFGKDLVNDILGPMGEHWVFYGDPATSGSGMLGFVGVNKLDDPAKAQSGISALVTAANNTLAGVARKENVNIQFRSTTVGDVKVNYLAVPFVSPAWAIKDGYLYFALYPQNVVTAVKRGLPAQSILDNPAFAAMRRRLSADNGTATAFTFNDLPKTAHQGYPMVLLMMRTVMGLSDLWGVNSPELVIPPLDEVMKHVAPAGSVSWTDDAGFHARSVSPFPGAEILAAPESLLPALIGPAAAIGAAADAKREAAVRVNVQQARAEAERAQAQALKSGHLGQMGMALHVYADAHGGELPPDLGTLVSGGQITNTKLFLSPRTTRAGVEPPAENVEAWINSESDYVYLGGGKRLSDLANPSEFIVVHEKIENVRGPRYGILFADGHVELVAPEQMKAKLEKQK